MTIVLGTRLGLLPRAAALWLTCLVGVAGACGWTTPTAERAPACGGGGGGCGGGGHARHHAQQGTATSASADASAAASAAPLTYGDAVAALDARSTAIARQIGDGDLTNLHAEALAVTKVTADVPKLAALANSGVPRSARSAVRSASKACAAASTDLDAAAASGDEHAATEAHAELARQVAILRQYAPLASATLYACPMHPEVTSSEPGQCPKCGMNLVRQDRR